MIFLQEFEPGTQCNIREAKLRVRLTLFEKQKKAIQVMVHLQGFEPGTH